MANSVLITGGTGSLGRALLASYLSTAIGRIVIFSRDEYKQALMAKEFPDERIRWFLGDVRDSQRLTTAFKGIGTIIHAAALKRVDRLSYDPSEAIKTNIIGTQNVIYAALEAGVSNVLLVSSDKAVQPINIYGATKLCAEWLAMMANSYSWPQGTKISAVRYGNVAGSRGSVVELWRQAIAAGHPVEITDDRCTRFWITMPQAIQLIHEALALMDGGEIFVPSLPSVRIVDVAQAVAPGHPQILTDLRPGGEKLHEHLINAEECSRCVAVIKDGDLGRHTYAIQPSLRPWGGTPTKGVAMPAGFDYRSDLNNWWLTPEQIRASL